MAYLKPHGALYHRVPRGRGAGGGRAGRVRATCPCSASPGALLRPGRGRPGGRTYWRGSPTAAYRGDRLVPRDEPGALLEDDDAIAAQAVDLAGAGSTRCACTATAPARSPPPGVVRRALEAAGFVLLAPW